MEGDGQQAGEEASLALGGFLLVVAALTLVFSRGIEALGFAREGDPGSKAFPVGLALALLAAGVWEIVRWYRERDEKRASSVSFSQLKSLGSQNVVGLGASLAAYVWLLGPLGFATATLLFCAPWMKRFGSGWGWAIAATAGLVVGVEILFAGAFQVRLPEGSTFLAIDRFMVNL